MTEPDTWIVSSRKGYELPANLQEEYFTGRYNALCNYAASVQTMLQEPHFIDDLFRIPIAEYLRYLVLHCETLVVCHDNQVMGAAVFSDVIPGRRAEFGGWIHPEFRKGIGNQRLVRHAMYGDVLDYAWNDLGLTKLTSRCAKINTPAIRLLENLGFRLIGESKYDMQVFGKLVDTLHFELINPKFKEILEDGWRRIKTTRTKLPAAPLHDNEPDEPGDEPAINDAAERPAGDLAPRYREVSVEEQLAFASGFEDDE